MSLQEGQEAPDQLEKILPEKYEEKMKYENVPESVSCCGKGEDSEFAKVFEQLRGKRIKEDG